MKFRTYLILAVLLLAFSAIPVLAQGPTAPVKGVTGVQAVALEDGDTQLGATYYAEDGTQYTLKGKTLSGKGGSYTYYSEPGDDYDGTTPPKPDTFSGAAILSGDKAIAAIANTTFDGSKGAAYGGVGAGSTSVLLPLVTVDNYGVTSILGLQNSNTTDAKDVVVSCTPQGGTAFDKEYNVKAGASKIVDLAGETGFDDPAPSSTAGWVGSCVVTPKDGTTEFVASAMNYSNDFVYAYSGMVSSGDTYYLPLVRSGFGGPVTGIQVVDANLTTNGDTTLAVEYSGFVDKNENYAEDAGEAYTCNVQATLPDNSSVTFYNSGDTAFTKLFGGDETATITGGDCQTNGDANFDAAGGKFLGSAKVVASGSTDPAIAVVVNDASAGNSAAYAGFLASDASSEVISPLSRSKNFGLTTGTQIQNISGDTITLRAKYSTSPLAVSKPDYNLNTTTPPDFTKEVGPGKSFTFYLPTQWTSGLDTTHGNSDWLGSVIVSVDGGTADALVGITNDAGVGDSSTFETILIP